MTALGRAQEAVALLDSMVKGGESHSDTSRAAVRAALDATRDPFDVRLEKAEAACRAWDAWLEAMEQHDSARETRRVLLDAAREALRGWQAVAKASDA